MGKSEWRVATKASSDMKFKYHVYHFLTRGLTKFVNMHEGEACYTFGDCPLIK